MAAVAKEIRGICKVHDSAVVDVSAVIFAPEPEDGERDWSCRIRCPFIFAADKRIVGVDADQALELAEVFVRHLLEHRGVELKDTQSNI